MDVNHTLIKQLRLERGWTQQQLSDIADLSLRTIQRVEKLGVASHETVSALCVVLEQDRSQILAEHMPQALQQAEMSISPRTKLSYVLVFIIGFILGSTSILLLG